MKRNLKGRIDALEQAMHGPEPTTIIVRHISGDEDDPPPIRSLTVSGRRIERKAGESEDQFVRRVEKLAPVVNGVRILHEGC
jgi:hypothetical protein